MKKLFLPLVAGVCALMGSMTSVSAQANSGREIQFMAHRGSAHEFDENTMYAFKECYKAGIRGYETDVRLTKDQDLILSHDESLYRTCGVDKQTEDMTTAECRQLRTKKGNPLAFCSELVDFLADKDSMYVEFEIKTVESLYTQAMLDVLCDKLYKMAMAKKMPNSLYLFTSFDARALSTMRRLHPDAELMLVKGRPFTNEAVIEAYQMGIKRLACVTSGSQRGAVKLAHDLGIIVSLWPSSNEEEFLLGVAYGADVLCCDKALRVSRWQRENIPFVKLKGVVAPAK